MSVHRDDHGEVTAWSYLKMQKGMNRAIQHPEKARGHYSGLKAVTTNALLQLSWMFVLRQFGIICTNNVWMVMPTVKQQTKYNKTTPRAMARNLSCVVVCGIESCAWTEGAR